MGVPRQYFGAPDCLGQRYNGLEKYEHVLLRPRASESQRPSIPLKYERDWDQEYGQQCQKTGSPLISQICKHLLSE